MGESDGEIEYLDEDEEIVNQCVQYANKSYEKAVQQAIPTPKPVTPLTEYQKSLIADRGRCRKRRRSSVYEEPDSDYDPTNDIRIEKGIKPLKQPSKRVRDSSAATEKHRPKIQRIKVETRTESESSQEKDEPPAIQQRKPSERHVKVKKEEEIVEGISEMIAKRREMEIMIPDYDDPLCLPVRVVSKQRSDRERVKKWNDLCLRYYQRYRDLQKDIVSSSREVTFRSRINPSTDKHETSVAARVTCKDKYKHTKVEEYRGLLPNFREIKVLQFGVDEVGRDHTMKEKKTISTVILLKETNNNEDCLTVYKPDDAIAAVYNCLTERVNKLDPTDTELRRNLQEMLVVRMCPTCFQMSNRRPSGDTKDDQPIKCAVCSRNFTSAYNLIRHVKTHAKKDVMPRRQKISAILSNIMNYHYTCRICDNKFNTITDLRKHVKQHNVAEPFDCEVCSQHVMAG